MPINIISKKSSKCLTLNCLLISNHQTNTITYTFGRAFLCFKLHSNLIKYYHLRTLIALWDSSRIEYVKHMFLKYPNWIGHFVHIQDVQRSINCSINYKDFPKIWNMLLCILYQIQYQTEFLAFTQNYFL